MGKLRITWTKSAIGYHKRQKATIEAMGFHRLGETIVLPDNAPTRGMIERVGHLVKFERVEDAPES